NNTASLIAFLPTILVWATRGRDSFRGSSARQVVEVALVAIVFVTVVLFVYGHVYVTGSLQQAFYLVPIPLLLWVAVQFGPAGLCLAITGLVCISAWCAYTGDGPFLASGVIDRATALQISWIMTSAPMLALAAVVRERKLAKTSSLEAAEAVNLA